MPAVSRLSIGGPLKQSDLAGLDNLQSLNLVGYYQSLSIFATNRHSHTPTVIPAQAGIRKSLRSSVAQVPGNGKTNRFPENKKALGYYGT